MSFNFYFMTKDFESLTGVEGPSFGGTELLPCSWEGLDSKVLRNVLQVRPAVLESLLLSLKSEARGQIQSLLKYD
jgi:hypothetical protein